MEVLESIRGASPQVARIAIARCTGVPPRPVVFHRCFAGRPSYPCSPVTRLTVPRARVDHRVRVRNANEPAVRRAVLLRFGRNIAMRGSRLGFTLIEILVVVAIGGVLITLTLFGLSCDGTCASVPCSETAPCTFAGSTYTIGNACAANVEGSVCDSNGFFPDCVCRNSVGPGNVLRAVCVS
jgi:prepilin-type N-terminal cleavage/methylation domain-containing protein